MKPIIVALFLLLLIPAVGFGQFRNKEYKDYLPYPTGTKVTGKVFTIDDTIQGIILIKRPIAIQDRFKLFEFGGDKIGVIKAKDALGFEYGGGSSVVRYKSFSTEDIPTSFGWDLSNIYQGANVFLLVLEVGRLNLYKYYFSSGGSMGANGMMTASIKSNYILEYRPGDFLKFPSLGWKDKLNVYFANYPSMASRINEKGFKAHDIPELIADFNRLYEEQNPTEQP